MLGVVIVSQGGLARELLEASREIAGDLSGFQAVSLDWSDNLEAAREKIRQALQEVEAGEGALVLVDMFGSTPCNAALELLEPGRVEILTGVNLPMVVRLSCFQQGSQTVAEAAGWLQAKVQASICRPSQMQVARSVGPCDPTPCEGAGE